MIKLTKLSEKLEEEMPDEVQKVRKFYFEKIEKQSKNERKKMS